MSVVRFAVSSILLLVVAVAAHATPKNFHVGPGCTYGSVQAALDDERANPGTPADFIWIARSQDPSYYSAQDIQVHDQNVFLYGGVDSCIDSSISGTTTLSGSGGAARAVMTITGNSQVWLSALTLTQGDSVDGAVGGGINFNGTGKLTISSSRISNNRAGYGAGINFKGTGGESNIAELWINYDTIISNNTATTSGGGLRVEGNSLLRVVNDQVWIANNHADGGYGGGILVIGPAQADLGSPGYRFAEYIPLIFQNTAQYGGGLAVIANAENQDAIVRLFTTNPQQPLGIVENIASNSGGGVFLQGYDVGQFGDSQLCGTDYHISANNAPEGSAIFAHNGTYGRTGINFASTYQSAFTCAGATLGAQPCTSQECRLIDDNVAQNLSGQATAGSTVLLQGSVQMYADRLRLRGNRGAHALREIGGGAYITGFNLSNCLIDDNVATGDLVTADSGSDGTLTNCTLAGNEIDTGVVLRFVRLLWVKDSIIAQGNATSLVYTGSNPASNVHADYILAQETASLAQTQGTNINQGDPAFVDAPGGDYRLLPTSPAIDRAPPVTGDDRDLDGKPRDQDMPGVPDGAGTRDLGAYERQLRYCGAADTVFCNNFDYD